METCINLLLLVVSIVQQMSCASNCVEYTNHISIHHPSETYQSPNPLGKWVSTRCEITPGFRYILRRFDIQASMFIAHIYHYKDSWCQTPSFTVKIRGRYELSSGTATPYSKSSFATKFDFDEIYVRITDSKELETIVNYIINKCPLGLPAIFQIAENETINSNEFLNADLRLEKGVLEKKACRYFFGLHSYSYKKIRMVKTKKHLAGIKHDELFFGDIPSKDTNPRLNPFTEFQYALSRLDRPNCEVCKRFKKVNVVPTMPLPSTEKSLKGKWVTEHCEAQDDTKFVSKYYEFTGMLPGEKYGIVKIYQSSFADSDCMERQFELKTGGVYYDVTPDNRVGGVFDVTITITWLALTAYDDGTLKVMRDGYRCGVAEKWKYGKEQNVTSTNGCGELGLIIPETLNLKTRIIKKKNGKTELYINDDNPKKYFTDNLISCSAIPFNITKHTTSTKKPVINPVDLMPIDNSVNKNTLDPLLKVNGKPSDAIILKNSTKLLLSLVITMMFLFCR